MNELVFELTGIDLHTTSKEDLHKVMKDEALSVVDFTPEPPEPSEPQEVSLAYIRSIDKNILVMQIFYKKKRHNGLLCWVKQILISVFLTMLYHLPVNKMGGIIIE